MLDEYSRECLAIVVARRLRADDVLQTLSELFVKHGPPANLRSDNRPSEFTAKVVREWLERVEVKTLYIEPGSPWENGYNESFNGTLGEEVLKREIFYSFGGGESAHRTVAAGVQHHPTPQLAPLPTTGPRSATARSLLLESAQA